MLPFFWNSRLSLTAAALTMLLGATFGTPASAASLTATDLPHAVSTVTVTDESTGTVIFQKSTTIEFDPEENTVTAEVEIPAPAFPSSFASVSGSQNPGSLSSKLTIHYSAKKDQIRTERVTGSWSPARGIILRNRSVQAYSGGQYTKTMKKSPRSNSYDYSTGWDWGIKPPSSPYLSPRALAQTQYKLSGTGGAWLTLSHWVDLQNV